jgi:hypothetical protein
VEKRKTNLWIHAFAFWDFVHELAVDSEFATTLKEISEMTSRCAADHDSEGGNRGIFLTFPMNKVFNVGVDRWVYVTVDEDLYIAVDDRLYGSV